MSRPAGVTASAIVAILGSVFTLVLAVFMVAALFMEPLPPQTPNVAPFIIAGAAMCVALAGVGIWTSVGLFRLRSWARTSILIFAGFLAAGCIFGLLVNMAVPMPPEISADTVHFYRLISALMFGLPTAIAIWWLIQFNTQSTKAAFASPIEEPASQRPLSISIIGWASLIGSASALFTLLARAPAFLFGAIFTGWAAAVIYVSFGALSLYIGKGLLDLRERARVVAIAWFGFSFLQLAVVTLIPPLRQRMLEVQRTIGQDPKNLVAIDMGMMMNVTLGFSAITVAAAIWFLVRNRAAFVRAENP